MGKYIGLLGAPSLSDRLAQLPHFERYRKVIEKLSPARKEPREWMPHLRSVDPAVSAMMQSLLRMEPVDRLSARLIIQGDFFILGNLR